jgi:hypothetical protein
VDVLSCRRFDCFAPLLALLDYAQHPHDSQKENHGGLVSCFFFFGRLRIEDPAIKIQ